MKDPNKLTIESGEQGSLTLKGSNGQLEMTKENLVDALADFPDSDDIIKSVQERKLAKKREQYEKLKPTGFGNAPDSAKEKRETLKTDDNVVLMQYLHDNVSYNTDGTINIIDLHKTFCEDISGQNNRFNFVQAQELEKTNSGGYKLMTDYNDGDTDEDKKQTDRYKIINIFSQNKGDTTEGMALFRDMAGCNDRYWTGTLYKNEKGEEVNGLARYRGLYKHSIYRRGYYTNHNNRVCGFKDSM